ncbi:MAG: phosphoribosylglycinamide synthetase C domain-containing protein, partial [Eubacterium sp.]
RRHSKSFELWIEGCEVFHAGTDIKDGKLVTAGGRVLCVSALGKNREIARIKVYNELDKIKFNGARYRTDIAKMID